MTDTSLIQLILESPFKTWLPPIAIFAVLNKYVFDGYLSKWLVAALMHLYKNMPFIWDKLKQESKNHFTILHRKPTPRQKKVNSWGFIVFDVSIATLMYMYCLLFIGIALSIAFAEHINLLKFTLSLTCVLLFLGAGEYYRKDARDIINKMDE